MGDELVGEDGGIGFDFHEIDGHGGDFGKNYAAQGVCESEVDISKGEVDGVLGRLDGASVLSCPKVVQWEAHFSDSDSRPYVLKSVHRVVVHGCENSNGAGAARSISRIPPTHS